MKRLVFVFILSIVYFFALASNARAQPAAVAPWMTGEYLLQRLQKTDPAGVPWTPGGIFKTRELAAEHRDLLNREFVEGYIYAVHDASEGKAWCFNEKYQVPNTQDFWDASLWGLHALPPAALKRSAAELLPEIWRRKWPCAHTQTGGGK